MTEKQDPNKAIALIRDDLARMGREFESALQGAIPTERFVRHVLTAVQMNPNLLAADRKSLWSAVMKSAQDALLPDGREGALVIYNTKVKVDGREVWRDTVQWQPMVRGLMKLARNSGEIASITAHVVHEFDRIRIVQGDDELIEHEPNLDAAENMKTARGAYAIATLKDGTKLRRWLSRAKIMKAKSVSKAPNGPLWTTFEEEGWLKTAIRNLTKYLPASTDREDAGAFVRAAERIDEDASFEDRATAAVDVTPPKADPLKRFMERKGVKPDAPPNGQQQAPEPKPEPELEDDGTRPEPPPDEEEPPVEDEDEEESQPSQPSQEVEIHFPGTPRPTVFPDDLKALDEVEKRATSARSQFDVSAIYEAARELLAKYPAMVQTLQQIAEGKPETPPRRGSRGQRDMLKEGQ